MPKKTVMIVDDEYIILETVNEILKKNGFRVITAISGEDALKKLKTAKVDLILVDMMMPGMNGLQLIQKIRKIPKLKNMKMAFSTIIAFSELQKYKFKKLKIYDYIEKPYSPKELVRKVNKIIQRRD